MKKNIIIAVVVITSILAMTFWFLKRDTTTSTDLTLYGNVDIRQVSLAFEASGRIQSLKVQEGDKVRQGQVLAQLNTDALKIQAQQAEAQRNVQKQAMLKQQVGARPEEIAQAKAQLLSTQVQLEKATQDLQRLQALNRSTAGQAMSKQQLEDAQSNQAAAAAIVKAQNASLQLLLKGARAEDRAATKAQYDVSQSNLDLIQYNLAQSELRSPVNAVVRARLQ